MRYTFHKTERLSSKLLIGRLFSDGDSFILYPFRVISYEYEKHDNIHSQILISVSKNKFKSAVKRIKIKRHVREAYRKSKHIVWDYYKTKPEAQLLIGLIYVGKTIITSKEIERKLILILHRLTEKDESNNR